MLFPSLDQSSSRFVRFSISGLLVIQSAIATIAMDAIASTQPSFAQDRPTPNTSVEDLKPIPILFDCSTTMDFSITMSHCYPPKFLEKPGVGPLPFSIFEPGTLRDAERNINSSSDFKLPAPQSDEMKLMIQIPFQP